MPGRQDTDDSELPLHRGRRRAATPPRSAPASTKGREKRLTFQRDKVTTSWKMAIMSRMRRWVQASTGSPSDGLGKETSSSASFSTFLASQAQLDREREDQDWVLDEVVVTGEESDHKHGSDKGTTTRQSESEHAGSLHRGYGAPSAQFDMPDTTGVWGFLRWVLWTEIVEFFEPRFEDSAKEDEYQKQVWYSNKRLAFFLSLFLWINWILYLVLNHSVSNFEHIAYYGGLTLVTFPLPFFVAYDLPRSHTWFFQAWLTIAVWYCGVLEMIEMYQCQFFHPITVRDDSFRQLCGDKKDFLAMIYYCTAIPALGMLVVLHRSYSFIAAIATLGLFCGLILPIQRVFIRNIIGFALFWAFIFYLHHAREMIERRMFMLNTQLKIAYRAQQKAQIAESKASHAKRRFASYIFHEVRVPLNTAMLAFQNLQVNNAFKDDSVESQNVEIHALEASLFMMQQVLNDVLDLERMDSGRFESNPRPFPLHRAIASIMGPVGLASDAKRLDLRMELDKKIDDFAAEDIPEGLWVIGDEIRLRQVLTNLASNAVKFTPEGGGEVSLTTKFLDYNAPKDPSRRPSAPGTATSDLSRGSQEKLQGIDQLPILTPGMNGPGAKEPQHPTVRFRLEVSDSGPGIRPSDLVEHRLFQPFVQTAVGKSSGKGTGLGLAIVRQIVSLSGGRLGVQSRRGEGACFWVELSYPVASPHDVQLARTSTPDQPMMSVMAPRAAVMQVGRPSKSKQDRLGIDSYADPANNPLAFSVPAPLPPGQSPPATTTFEQKTLEIRNSPAPILTSSLPPQARVQSNEPPVTLSPPDNPLRVLCVDDDELTRSLMTRMLNKQGCIVETANDGIEALDLLLKQNRRYDLVTLDNYMPNASGEEVIRQVRDAGRDDLVVGCTGNALTEDQASYLEAGVDRILTKPIMLKDLKTFLQVALARRAQQHPSDSPAADETR
ncbi:hypothetical protein BKA62DRAFT_121650 [Auriculariales sp. MPI-PUGE-AT-0066]|nr:hypothetical protein BKA62DRAFT_121650 [Auriculariales sp. MPI-PUGE-AT-0066]